MSTKYEDSFLNSAPDEPDAWEIERNSQRRHLVQFQRGRLLMAAFCTILPGIFILVATIGCNTKIPGGRWHSVTANIIQTIAQPTVVDENPWFGRRSMQCREFVPVVEVSYKVDGIEHQSRCPVGKPTFLIEEARVCLDKFSIGQNMQVYYDVTAPDKPNTSPGLNDPQRTAGISLGIFLIVLGLVFLIARRLKSRELDSLSSKAQLQATPDRDTPDNDSSSISAHTLQNPEDFEQSQPSIRSSHLISPLLDAGEVNPATKPITKDTKPRRISIFMTMAIVASIASALWGFSKIKANFDTFELATEALSWPTTTGIVISSTVNEYNHRYYDKSDHTTYSNSTFSPTVTFSYKVNGVYLESSRFSLATRANCANWGERNIADAIVQKYKPGLKVKVYYNPKDPNMAIIQPGYEPESFSFPHDDFSLIIFGIALLPFLAVQWIIFKRNPAPESFGKYQTKTPIIYWSGSSIVSVFLFLVICGLGLPWFVLDGIPKFLPQNGIVHLDLEPAQNLEHNKSDSKATTKPLDLKHERHTPAKLSASRRTSPIHSH